MPESRIFIDPNRLYYIERFDVTVRGHDLDLIDQEKARVFVEYGGWQTVAVEDLKLVHLTDLDSDIDPKDDLTILLTSRERTLPADPTWNDLLGEVTAYLDVLEYVSREAEKNLDQALERPRDLDRPYSLLSKALQVRGEFERLASRHENLRAQRDVLKVQNKDLKDEIEALKEKCKSAQLRLDNNELRNDRQFLQQEVSRLISAITDDDLPNTKHKLTHRLVSDKISECVEKYHKLISQNSAWGGLVYAYRSALIDSMEIPKSEADNLANWQLLRQLRCFIRDLKTPTQEQVEAYLFSRDQCIISKELLGDMGLKPEMDGSVVEKLEWARPEYKSYHFDLSGSRHSDGPAMDIKSPDFYFCAEEYAKAIKDFRSRPDDDLQLSQAAIGFARAFKRSKDKTDDTPMFESIEAAQEFVEKRQRARETAKKNIIEMLDYLEASYNPKHHIGALSYVLRNEVLGHLTKSKVDDILAALNL